MSKKEAVKLSKREQLRAERRRRARMWNFILLGGGGLLVMAIAAYQLANARPGPLPGEMVIPDEGHAHVPSGSTINYDHYPPSSGTHYGDQVAPWDVYTEPIPEGVFVHNLEHGGVVFLYRCDQPCPDLAQQFQDLYEKVPPATPFSTKKVLVTPYERDLPSPIVALAWDHQLNLQAFDEAVLLRWYKRFVNRGTEEAGRVP